MRVLVVLAVSTWLALPGAADATTLIVTSTTDSNDGACTASLCSLRDAVAAAGAGDTVSVPASASHYLVTLGQIDITKPLTIQGAATDTSVIDAKSRSRAFRITPDVGAGGTVTLQDVTITGGASSGLPGGCLRAASGSGTLVLAGAAVTNCSVVVTNDADGRTGGGAIYTEGAGLTITRSSLSGNSVIANGNGEGFNGGGAIFYFPRNGGTLSIADSDLSGNSVTANDNPGGVNGGGAIINIHGAMDLLRTTLTANSVTANRDQWNGVGNNGGGAILDDSGPTTLTESTVSRNTVYAKDDALGGNGGGGILAQAGAWTIVRSTIADNIATVSDTMSEEGGGGINATNLSLTIVASTISGNVADLAAGASTESGGGGILDAARGFATYVNTTIANNRTNVHDGAGNGGGGVSLGRQARFTSVTLVGNSSSAAPGGGLYGLSGFTRVKSTILAHNSAPQGANCWANTGNFMAWGINLEYGGFCTVDGAFSRIAKDPRLGPLRANGGPTATMEPGPRSPALDAIPLRRCTDQSKPPQKLSTDQRGFARPNDADAGCDVGAVESAAPRPPANRTRPRITGRARRGATLTAHPGRWLNQPTDVTHQWLRCNARGGRCHPIAGAIGLHYRVSGDDDGHRIRVRERASNGVGRAVTRTSAATRVVGRRVHVAPPSSSTIVGELR